MRASHSTSHPRTRLAPRAGLLGCSLALGLFGGGCDSATVPTDGAPPSMDAGPDGSSATDAGPPPSTNGTPCTRMTTDCDPDCGFSCGSSPGCLELCCRELSSAGIWCNGVCIEDRCYTATCEANQSRPWSCVQTRFGCTCGSDPAQLEGGTPVASCVADSGGYCTYSFLGDWCNCNLGGGGSVASSERTTDSCSTRPTCDCPSACM